jgi:hypothetical protein
MYWEVQKMDMIFDAETQTVEFSGKLPVTDLENGKVSPSGKTIGLYAAAAQPIGGKGAPMGLEAQIFVRAKNPAYVKAA